MPAEGGTCTAARWCWPVATRSTSTLARRRCPPPTSSWRPTPECTSPRARPARRSHRRRPRLRRSRRSSTPRSRPGRWSNGTRRRRTRRISSSRSTRRRAPARAASSSWVAAAAASTTCSPTCCCSRRPRGPTIEIEARFGAHVHVVHGGAAPRGITGAAGSLVTLLPVGGIAHGIVTDGLQYPLAQRRPGPGTSRGVSNVLAGTVATVALDAGTLLVVQPDAKEPDAERERMIVDIEVVPQPLGTATNPYAHVEAAIALAQASGLHYEVNALGTTIEGPPDELWPLLRRMHESCLESGAEHVITVLKIAQHADADIAADDRRPHREVPHVSTVGRRVGRVVPPLAVLRCSCWSAGSCYVRAAGSRTTCCRRRARSGGRSSTWRRDLGPDIRADGHRGDRRSRRGGRRRRRVGRADRDVAVRARTRSIRCSSCRRPSRRSCSRRS